MTQTEPPNHPPADNPWVAPPFGSGYTQGQYPMPTSEPAKSVRGLGIATQIMLAISFAANIALLFPALHERSLFQQLRNDPTSVSISEADDADRTLNALSVTSTMLYIATGIVWIIWFYRARKNVEAWQPQFQRRAEGWAIGGWFCPVVNLWFPATIARDILDDSTRDPDRPRRGSHPVVALWGVGFALMIVSGIALRGSSSSADEKIDRVNTIADFNSAMDSYITLTGVTIANIVITVLTAIPAVLLVRAITSAQTTRMQQVRPAY